MNIVACCLALSQAGAVEPGPTAQLWRLVVNVCYDAQLQERVRDALRNGTQPADFARAVGLRPVIDTTAGDGAAQLRALHRGFEIDSSDRERPPTLGKQQAVIIWRRPGPTNPKRFVGVCWDDASNACFFLGSITLP